MSGYVNFNARIPMAFVYLQIYFDKVCFYVIFSNKYFILDYFYMLTYNMLNIYMLQNKNNYVFIIKHYIENIV